MGGKAKDNAAVERICLAGGHVDVELEPEGHAFIGVFEGSGKLYVRIEFGGSNYVDDLIGALQRLRTKVKKSEE